MDSAASSVYCSGGRLPLSDQDQASIEEVSTVGSQLSGSGLCLRDLSELKALKKPPPPIRMLMEVCCLLFHIEPVRLRDEHSTQGKLRGDYWEPARRYLLSDPFFL